MINKFVITLLLLSAGEVLCAQNSVSLKVQNDHPMSQQAEDSIFRNNPLAQQYKTIVKLDTAYWKEYPQIQIDSIAQLKGISANEFAKQVLDIKQSKFYSDKPFNLIGTYNESELRDSLKQVQHLETKVTLYDESFISDKLPKAQTDKCNYVYKSTEMNYSAADLLKNQMGGIYSNLYNILDLDFLRMYNIQNKPELGVDRRIWCNRSAKFEVFIPENFRYYKAFKKDSSIYVVLVSSGECSLLETLSKPNSPIKITNSGNEPKDTLKEYKYLLVNLNANAIEKTGYYHCQSAQNPFNVQSYETSYKLIDGKYYLNEVNKYEFVCIPNINHISLNGQYFHVDSVITDPLKVKKIRTSAAEQRNVNYINEFTKKEIVEIDMAKH